MNRDVCEHFAPRLLPCWKCKIDPASQAGILLREFDTPRQALRYAEKQTANAEFTNPQMAAEYAETANLLREYVDAQQMKS